MPNCHLTTRWGNGINNPQYHDLVAALGELDQSDIEHPDCCLNTEEGWSLSVYESALVVLENVETGEGPWHMRPVSRDHALELWLRLQSGDMVRLRSKSWLAGYGNA